MVTEHDPRAAALAALGLPPQATREQVAAAYHRAARATHPDRCADADAAERFAAVVAAHRQAIREPRVPPSATAPRAEAKRYDTKPPPNAPLVAGPVFYTPYRPPSQSRQRERRT